MHDSFVHRQGCAGTRPTRAKNGDIVRYGKKACHPVNAKPDKNAGDKCNLLNASKGNGPNGIRTRGLLGASEALCQTELWAQSLSGVNL